MGVHGLWELLSPVGRRVSVETLAGKKLAIDASIWMIQFMKAMRDEQGEMVRNAHILGFFRRICKLLFLRTKPVFVFDGGTPALKRRTVVARRRQRENAQAKIRKTAEKLLLNHLKAMRLKELANDLDNQRKESGDKGKRVITDEANIAGSNSKTNQSDSKGYDQESLDAMLAASIEAEERGGFRGDASTSDAGVLAKDEDSDDNDDEEMLLPTLQGKVDPVVLASLPPSMQLDLLVQMRERLMAENRQKYQKVKKAPARFSELQIQAYLKTVAFRREIDQVQKAASGRGIGGVQTSRIASESNREFIFSSSFTGNRQSFASTGVEANSSTQSEIPTKKASMGSVNDVASTSKSNSAIESIINGPRKAFDEDVETYMDGKGRVRVSKVRAMGFRMTRDLQRNLDLMKEIENSNDGSGLSKILESFSNISSNKPNQASIPVNGTSIEMSFGDDNEEQFVNNDDDVFARIVAGDPLVASSTDKTPSLKQSSVTLSDCEVERPLTGCSNSDESDVEWEEGPSDNPELFSVCEVEHRETVSKGDLLEEADFQEAIRRSMNDMRCQKDVASSVFEESKDNKNTATNCARSAPRSPSGVHDRLNNVDEIKINLVDNSSSTQLEAITSNDQDFMKVKMETSCGSDLKYHQDASDDQNSQGETGRMDVVNPSEENGVESSNELHEDNSIGNAETLNGSNRFSCTTTHIPNSPDIDMPDVALPDAKKRELTTLVIDHVTETTLEPKEADVKESKADFDAVDESVFADVDEEQVEITKASLEEEMTNLTKERTDLGDEQRRLERNAESVSGEMFAECQELLQMFGLPYIIAPMEAEAQCAFMELENLVDGVVTDDSDVFLFGARSVYKNIFDDRKYVETYFMKDIETELGLTREKLIRMAMLLGSDYTEGISGIGIVNAIEVLNAFPEDDGLHKFREWIESPDPSILGKIDTKRRGSNSNPGGASTDDEIESVKQIFKDKHRNVSKNWHIPSTFPSEAVVSAYASPQVDKSTEPFSWGKPDLFVLRKLCSEKFGWGTQKADELLQPVLKEYNKHETQLRLEAFYTFNERFAKIRSKRISKAVKGIAGSKTLELMDDNKPIEKSELPIQEGPRRNSKERLGVRGRGRGRGRSVGRGRRKTNDKIELSETSSDDGNKSNDLQEEQHEVRKSKRVRKWVTYTNEDSENDEPSTQDHTEVAANGEPSKEEENLVDPVATGSGASLGEAELDRDCCENDVGGGTEVDYLKMGGGFCLEEEEEEGEGGSEPCRPAGELDGGVATSPVAGVSDENLVSFLSAIPNLRRKRKKT